MSLTVAPNVNVDTLKRLDANKMYFLSSTTGEVKEGGRWMRFKCAIGVSSALQKVSNLVDAVRTTLLDAADQEKNAKLDTEISTVDLTHLVSGNVITGMVNRFAAENAESMAKKSAKREAAVLASHYATKVLMNKCGIGNLDPIKKIFMHAFKPIFSGQMPTMVKANGQRVLDRNALDQALRTKAEEIYDLIGDIHIEDGFKINDRYADHIIDTLFTKGGERKEGSSVGDLKTNIAVDVDTAFQLNGLRLGSRADAVYNNLVKQGIDPEKKLAQILGFCGKNNDLKEYVLNVAPELCMNAKGELRSDDTIKSKISAIEGNLAEIKNIEKKFPGSAQPLKYAMMVLGSNAFPRGLLKDIAACVKAEKFTALKSLNSLSKADEIFDGIEELRNLLRKIWKNLNIEQRFNAAGQDEVGGPEAVAVKTVAITLALAKMGPGLMARLPYILKSGEYAKMLGLMNGIRDNINGTSLADKNAAKEILIQAEQVTGYVEDRIRLILGDDITVESIPQDQLDLENDISVGEMLGTLENAKL